MASTEETQHERLDRQLEQREKRQIVRRASVCAVLGLVALGIAMTGAVVLVTDVIFATMTVVVTGVGVAALIGWSWFATGLIRRAAIAHPR